MTDETRRINQARFTRSASEYAASRVTARREQIEALMALASPAAHDRVLDVACGPGALLATLAPRVRRTVGLDLTPAMLQLARAAAPKAWCVRGAAERLPFDDCALDAVLSTSAFHFFDQHAALDEFYRVLAPGGFAAIATLSPDRHSVPALRRVLDDRVPANTPTPDEMRTMFERAAFEVALQRPVHRTLTVPFAMVDWITVGLKHNADVG